MPPRAIKHQLACPIELTSGSFLIGRRGILVIPRNRLDRTWEGWAVSVPIEPAWSKSNEILLQINVLQEFSPHALYQHCCGNSRLWIFTSRFFGNISLIFPRIFWQVRGSYTIQLLLIINSFHIENTRSLVFRADLVSFDHYIKPAFRIISPYGLHSWLFRAYWDIPENIHTPPMDNIGNPVRNAQWVWLEIHKYPQFCEFNRNSRKTIQIFAKFWNSWRFWISRLWNSAKIAVVLLGNPQIFGYSIRCHPGGGWIFSGRAHCHMPILIWSISMQGHQFVYCFTGTDHSICGAPYGLTNQRIAHSISKQFKNIETSEKDEHFLHKNYENFCQQIFGKFSVDNQ